jgi:hypothetical protein
VAFKKNNANKFEIYTFFKLRIKTCSYIYNNNKVNHQFVYNDVIRDVTPPYI